MLVKRSRCTNRRTGRSHWRINYSILHDQNEPQEKRNKRENEKKNHDEEDFDADEFLHRSFENWSWKRDARAFFFSVEILHWPRRKTEVPSDLLNVTEKEFVSSGRSSTTNTLHNWQHQQRWCSIAIHHRPVSSFHRVCAHFVHQISRFLPKLPSRLNEFRRSKRIIRQKTLHSICSSEIRRKNFVSTQQNN